MRKFLFTIMLMALVVLAMGPGEALISRFLLLESPTSQKIGRGDWLSKIALKNYGDASYWRELALVNRAPNADLIFPEEQIIIPSFAAVQKIRTTRSLEVVNEIIREQEQMMASNASKAYEGTSLPETEQPNESEFVETQSEPLVPELQSEASPSGGDSPDAILDDYLSEESSTPFFLSTPVLTGAALLIVVVAIAFVMYRRNKKRQDAVMAARDIDFTETGKDEPEFQTSTTLLFPPKRDWNLDDDKEEKEDLEAEQEAEEADKDKAPQKVPATIA